MVNVIMILGYDASTSWATDAWGRGFDYEDYAATVIWYPHLELLTPKQYEAICTLCEEQINMSCKYDAETV